MDATRLPAGTDRDVPRLRRRLPQDNRQGIRQNKGPGWGGRQRKGKTINNLMLAHNNIATLLYSPWEKI